MALVAYSRWNPRSGRKSMQGRNAVQEAFTPGYGKPSGDAVGEGQDSD
jgi:hypothetical protein